MENMAAANTDSTRAPDMPALTASLLVDVATDPLAVGVPVVVVLLLPEVEVELLPEPEQVFLVPLFHVSMTNCAAWAPYVKVSLSWI